MRCKSLILIILALSLLFSFGCTKNSEEKHLAGSELEDNQFENAAQDRRISQIKLYCEDGTTVVDDIIYNAKGQVSRIESPTYHYVYSYDDAGRLTSLRVLDIENGNSKCGESIYTYNTQGRLVEEYHWAGGDGRFIHEYDGDGRKIKTTSLFDSYREEEVFTHDSLGRPISSVITCIVEYDGIKETWTETAEYAWDEEGRPAQNVYDYKPIVMVGESIYIDKIFYSIPYDSSHYPRDWYIYMEKPEVHLDENGYVLKLVSGETNRTVEFIYKNSSNE